MIGLKVNRIIKYLIISDLVFWSSWGLITPIFAVFIIEKIEGGSVFIVGIATAVYWILRSFLRIPIGIFLDTCPGEKDDYLFLVIGLFIAALVPFGFVFASLPIHVYLLQAVYAVGMAMTSSGWAAIFTRHIDKGRESTEWGIDATSVGFGIGIFGAIGGWAVTKFGFDSVFIIVGIFGLVGASMLLFLRKDIRGVFDHGLHFSFKDIFDETRK